MTTTALETVAHWIGGERSHEASRYGEVTDPATGAVTRRVAFASTADVDRAVAAATAGFEAWSAQSLTQARATSCSGSASCSPPTPASWRR